MHMCMQHSQAHKIEGHVVSSMSVALDANSNNSAHRLVSIVVPS